MKLLQCTGLHGSSIKCLRTPKIIKEIFKKRIHLSICFIWKMIQTLHRNKVYFQTSYGGSENCFYIWHTPFQNMIRKTLQVYLQEQVLFCISNDALTLNSSAFWFVFECKKWNMTWFYLYLIGQISIHP